MILRALLTLAVTVAPAALASEAAVCRVGNPDYTTFHDVTLDFAGDYAPQGTLRLGTAIDLTGFFVSNDAAATEIAYSGALPTAISVERLQRLGAILYRADVSNRMTAANAPAGTKIVVEVSRPEVPSATFAATIGLYAEFVDGTRSALCRGQFVDACVTALDTLNCESL